MSWVYEDLDVVSYWSDVVCLVEDLIVVGIDVFYICLVDEVNIGKLICKVVDFGIYIV